MQEMSNNLQIQTVPPGFRFHPTDEELVDYYLRRKMNSIRIEMDVIKEIDLYKVEPWDLNELCGTGMEETDEWYFFSYKDKKYPTGTRTNRATAMGFWKATGRDKAIYSNGGGGGGGGNTNNNNNNGKRELIGLRKTLVYYQGRAPNGQKSDWIMHEYRLESEIDNNTTYSQEEGWVVCRVFRKRMAATARRLQAINELEPPSQFWPIQQNYNNNHQHSSFILPASTTTAGSSTQQGSDHHNQQQMMLMMNNASSSDYQFLLDQTTGCSSDMIKSELLIHDQLPNLSNQYCHDHQQTPFPSTLVAAAGQSASSADDYDGSDGGWSVHQNNVYDQSHHGKNTQQQQRRMSMIGGRKEQRQKQRFQQQQFTAASPMLMQQEEEENRNMVDHDEQMTDWRVLDKLVASQLSPDVDEYEDAFETSDD